MLPLSSSPIPGAAGTKPASAPTPTPVVVRTGFVFAVEDVFYYAAKNEQGSVEKHLVMDCFPCAAAPKLNVCGMSRIVSHGLLAMLPSGAPFTCDKHLPEITGGDYIPRFAKLDDRMWFLFKVGNTLLRKELFSCVPCLDLRPTYNICTRFEDISRDMVNAYTISDLQFNCDTDLPYI